MAFLEVLLLLVHVTYLRHLNTGAAAFEQGCFWSGMQNDHHQQPEGEVDDEGNIVAALVYSINASWIPKSSVSDMILD